MDSRKPLTAGEIEELMTEALGLCESIKPGTTQGGVHRLLHILPRLLSMPTPPPDAAVREAVERVAALKVEYPPPPLPAYEPIVCMDASDRDTLLRAVQAPRLTVEQVEAVTEAERRLRNSGYGADEIVANELRAAFPEAFAGEVGRG